MTVGSSATLRTTSADDNGTARWSVNVPAAAPYITGTSVPVAVNASKTYYTAPNAVTRTLTVDLVAPTAPIYTAPGSLTVGGGDDGDQSHGRHRHRLVQRHGSSVWAEH